MMAFNAKTIARRRRTKIAFSICWTQLGARFITSVSLVPSCPAWLTAASNRKITSSADTTLTCSGRAGQTLRIWRTLLKFPASRAEEAWYAVGAFAFFIKSACFANAILDGSGSSLPGSLSCGAWLAILVRNGSLTFSTCAGAAALAIFDEFVSTFAYTIIDI